MIHVFEGAARKRRVRISHSVQGYALPYHGLVGSDRIDSRPVRVGFVVDKVALVDVTLSVVRFYPVNKFHPCPTVPPLPQTVYNLINIGSVVK